MGNFKIGDTVERVLAGAGGLREGDVRFYVHDTGGPNGALRVDFLEGRY